MSKALDSWIEGMTGRGPEPSALDQFRFPTQELLEEFTQQIHTHSEADIFAIVRRLIISSGFLGVDSSHLEWLALHVKQGDITTVESELSDGEPRPISEYERRLLASLGGRKSPPPWEGITWILDLLPHWPQTAIDVLGAYILAHAQMLPDGRYAGLDDARVVIRARFVGLPGSDVSERIEMLLRLKSRDFERVVERYFADQGYETVLTPAVADGGRDILANRSDPLKERLVVECKNWRDPVGIPQVQRILGVSTSEKATLGVVIATGGFTGPARKWAEENAVSLLDGELLVPRFNAVFGERWPSRIDRILDESRHSNP